MERFNEILDYAEAHDSDFRFVFYTKPHTLINKIDEKIEEFKTKGNHKQIIRIVIEDEKYIFLQSKDNGDYVIFKIDDNYKHKQSLIEGLSVYCKANDLLYTKI